MADETLTPEALERLEQAAKAYADGGCGEVAWKYFAEASPTTILALLASCRTLQSENRIAMRALDLACEYHRDSPQQWLAESKEWDKRLAEARAQEGGEERHDHH